MIERSMIHELIERFQSQCERQNYLPPKAISTLTDDQVFHCRTLLMQLMQQNNIRLGAGWSFGVWWNHGLELRAVRVDGLQFDIRCHEAWTEIGESHKDLR